MANTKERRAWSTSLIDGADNRLIVRLEKRPKDWRVQVVHQEGSGKQAKRSRGASAIHTDEKAGRAAVVKLITAAKKQGWKDAPVRGGFAAKPDAFSATALPAPKGGRK